MVAVRGVVFRAEHGIEHAACAVVDLAQKQAFGAGASPIVLNAHSPSVVEDEPGHVYRIVRRVAAERRVFPAVDVAACVGAGVLESYHACAKIHGRCRLHE